MTGSLPRASVVLAPTALVGEQCCLGCLKEERLRADRLTPSAPEMAAPVVISERCLIFNQVVLYEGVRLGEDCVVEDRVRVGYDSSVGARTRLAYGAYICDRVTIGADARVAGFVCDGVSIGDRSTVMGELVHEYTQPHRDWWDVDEAPPVVAADTVVAYGARVVGGVRIGPRAYVAAGAVVTRDVPPDHVVVGVNVQVPADEWRGDRLQGLLRHWVRLRTADVATR
ncbi:DapH/DapD/GlmU-related protein [Pseudofrankia sp. BMG5.37]|uniref:acyltransferase n=1 Tax=Pseudofrankia sp. BMG5.37 TaxID=3050035 RepID=UPI002895B55F|nr:DapH/DapD/GlmU-related protein [Pseudofrankia sp. BMG5.37]MDT3444476.1 DapH/DapD/GlmU-related protein [Pseudofrankia sp. BMG5.37]